MTRRARAIGFASAAAICAGLAAGAAGGGRSDPIAELGELREVVVATRSLPAGRPLGQRAVAGSLEVRRVPARFVPSDALSTPAQASGRRPTAMVPPGAYLLGSQLRTPGARRAAAPRQQSLGAGREPVEITVEGAGAIGNSGPRRRQVDVVVTTESTPGGPGRTFVAAEAVALLALRPAGEAGATGGPTASPGDASVATLALTRAQALRLIHAQSFAREVRLIGS